MLICDHCEKVDKENSVRKFTYDVARLHHTRNFPKIDLCQECTNDLIEKIKIFLDNFISHETS